MGEKSVNNKLQISTKEYDRDNVLSEDAYSASEMLMQPGFIEGVSPPLKRGVVRKVENWGGGNFFVSYITPDGLPLGAIWNKDEEWCKSSPNGFQVGDFIEVREEDNQIADLSVISRKQAKKLGLLG